MNEVEREKARVKTKSIGIAFVTFATREEAKIVASDHKLGNGGGCMFFLCSLFPNWILNFFWPVETVGMKPTREVKNYAF